MNGAAKLTESHNDSENDVETGAGKAIVENATESVIEKVVHEKDIEKAREAKERGNTHFKAAKFEEASESYTEAIDYCPENEDVKCQEELSTFYSNRAACGVMLEKWNDVVEDCTNALKFNEKNIKALLRRGKAYEKLDKISEALADMKAVVALDPSIKEAVQASVRLAEEEKVRNEKMKDEMIGKLKELGNGLLGKFGMSLDNFKANKDPATGSYNISYGNK